MRGECGNLSQIVEDDNADTMQASYDDAYSNVQVKNRDQTGSNVDQTKSICEVLLDVGLFKSNLFGDLSKWRGYLRGRSGL